MRFQVMLSTTLTQAELQAVADASWVEFGSDRRYLATPEPATAGLLAIGVLLAAARRRA